ncbi:protein kinase [bacterium]|jgi:eukaryotic-like serine/threonine-protein kinase|nr:protein kinase [bacterium]MDB4802302.1 protein kinase [bacterium]
MSTVEETTDSGHEKWMWPFEQIGEGGMGLVYRAKYVVNGREVALKMLPKDVTDETTLARFERELEVLKNLKHPNIVRCFGGACENNRRFYAMELVRGGTLEDKLEDRKKLPWEQVIFYGLQMCDALTCSHSQGVIHRDLKPANFLITEAGKLKLSDFGLASVAAARKITAAGKTAGTFLYMAPEQIHGHKVSAQTDLYALGCVLYELITGEPPFVGDTAAATLHMHCRDTPQRPTEKALDCPIELERIILQLLEKKEEDRPESATEVGKRLEAVKQTVAVLPKDRVTQLERTVPAMSTTSPPSTRVLKPSVAEISTPSLSIPGWTVIPIIMVLLLSLLWNVLNRSTGEVKNPAGDLWVNATSPSHSMPIRLEAIHALGEISKSTEQYLGVLKSGLEDESGEIREASIFAMKNAGANAKELTPSLIAITKDDPNSSVRDAARNAVETLQATEVNSQFSWLKTVSSILFLVTLAASYYVRKKFPDSKLQVT